jgi:hypothetical protein
MPSDSDQHFDQAKNDNKESSTNTEKFICVLEHSHRVIPGMPNPSYHGSACFTRFGKTVQSLWY